MNRLVEDLYRRGLVENCTDREGLEHQLSSEKTTIYCGFDPTADSLHVGNLLPLTALKKFVSSGHKVLVLLGTTTAMIGDPSGKSSERVFISQEQIEKNCSCIEAQIRRILDVETNSDQITFLKNSDWLQNLSLVDFLRSTGKSFSVNSMINKESVKSRLSQREQGISYTEFSYMLLQAHDYLHLSKEFNCKVQLGGSDQWGNITAGLELIRKENNITGDNKTHAYGLVLPLLTKSDGQKLGKTEQGNVWLDKTRTSPYQFYQYWLNLPDEDALKLCYMLTEINDQEFEELKKSEPHLRAAQKYLAESLTTTCHGAIGLESAKKATEVFFGKEVEGLKASELKEIFKDVPSSAVSREVLGGSIVDLLASTKFLPSKSQARKMVESGGISINNKKVTDVDSKISENLFIENQILILKQGKKKYHLVTLS